MLTFSKYLIEEKQKDAERSLEDGSYRASLGDHSKQVRLRQMGFKVADDKESMQHAENTYANKPEGKPLGEIPLPKLVTQHEVDKEKAKSLIPHYDKLPPIKVAKVNGEHVVVDGHHRLAVAKALGKKTIKANQVN